MARGTRAHARWLVALILVVFTAGCAKSVDNTHSGGSANGGTGTGGAGTSGNGGTAPDAAAGASAGGSGGSAGTAPDASSGGSAGSAGSAGSGGASGDAGACPSLHGPTMVHVAGQCIDSTEVTNADYAAFLAANVPTSGQPSFCSWNTLYTPSGTWPATGQDNYPVVYVNWCDAYAYCKWAGKRLCGHVSGGSNDYAMYASTSSQWYNACSNGGTTAYPYGDNYDGKACNGVDYGANAALPVGQASQCEGGWPGVFDMSGNVWEWEDSCQATSGPTDQCRLRGGSYWYSGAANMRCDTANANDRMTENDIVGFRCCAP